MKDEIELEEVRVQENQEVEEEECVQEDVSNHILVQISLDSQFFWEKIEKDLTTKFPAHLKNLL